MKESEYINHLRQHEVQRIQGDTFEHVLYDTFQTIRTNIVRVFTSDTYDSNQKPQNMVACYAYDHRNGRIDRYGIGGVGEPHGYGISGLGFPELDHLVQNFHNAMSICQTVTPPNNRPYQTILYDIEKGREYYRALDCVIPDEDITPKYGDDVALVEQFGSSCGQYSEAVNIEFFNPARRADTPPEYVLEPPDRDNTFFSLFLYQNPGQSRPFVRFNDTVYRLDTNALTHKLNHRQKGFFIRIDPTFIDSLMPYATLDLAPNGIPLTCGRHLADANLFTRSGSKQYPDEWVNQDDFFKEYGDVHANAIAYLNEESGWNPIKSPYSFLNTQYPQEKRFTLRLTARGQEDIDYSVKNIPPGLHRDVLRVIEIEPRFRDRLGLLSRCRDGTPKYDFQYIDLRFQNTHYPYISPANP